MKNILAFTFFLLILSLPLWAQEQSAQSQPDTNQGSTQAATAASLADGQPTRQGKEALSKVTEDGTPIIGETDEVNYTLGTNDVIEIKVQSHPELSGIFSINSEGKIQYEFAGDVAVGGLTKKAAEDKIMQVVSQYVIDPRLTLKIAEYHSKAVYVMGQVSRPGKYYIRSERIPVREAIVEAGMPLVGSAMHRARLITPSTNTEAATQIVDLNALLYKGDLKYNLEMRSGDQLYVPSTQEEYIQAKSENSLLLRQSNAAQPVSEAVRYTLGPDDVIGITIQRHPEFSGTYPVNLEGKIQMDIVGDIDVTGLTKKELEEKIGKLLSRNSVDISDVSVTIQEYRSKVYYVIGEVASPGKFFMRSESIPVREAVVEAGLPTLSAAMRKCRLITPSKDGKVVTRKVDLYSVLYKGDLKKNLEMRPGDFLYVPSTVMAKAFRVIAPVTEPVTSAAATQSGVTTLNSLPTATTSGTK